MSRLVFLFEGGGSASTDVLRPKGQPDNHDLAIKRALADLMPRTARVQPNKRVRKVVYKKYDESFRTAFRDYPVPVDLEAINDRLVQIQKEIHADPTRYRRATAPSPAPEGEGPADPEPDDPEGGAPSD